MDPRRNARFGGSGTIAGLPQPAASPRRPGAPAPAAPSRSGPAIQETIDQLARDVQQLRVDFERFMSGALPVPPEELRSRIHAQLRQLRNLNLTAAVDNFRLSDIEARYNTYNELFNRRLRDREEGRRVRPAAPATTVAEPRYDAGRGIVVNGPVEPGAVVALYQGLASGAGEAPRFDLASFQTYLERQAASIRERTGCSRVQFRLAVEDGKTKLKARPIGAPEGR
ncbi:MAG TPA: MXAN_5187 C-terminal domain-containing protein [Thermoanaerobaculia bacterium]|nr:MXAN_5187 C-terminal domain-containing protein [Thermoanaerobaculia bacterium]